MSWINLADERVAEELESYGVSWKLELPRNVGKEEIEVNPRRLRRIARRAGLGVLTVTSGRIEQKTTASLNVNFDGTVSATNARMNPRYSRGVIDRGDSVFGFSSRMVNAFYRPNVEAQVDIEQLGSSHRRIADNDTPAQWGKALDYQIKSAVAEGSIHANVIDAAVPSGRWDKHPILLATNVATIGLKGWFAYKGLNHITEIGEIVESAEQAAIAIPLYFGLSNAFAFPFYGVMQGIMGGRVPKPSDFKASLIDPMIPIDRPMIAGIHQYLGAPAVRGIN